MCEEVWKDIAGFEGLYQVSNLGKVKSIERYKRNGKGLQKVPERLIYNYEKPNGYLQVQLHKDRTRKQICVHRLVAMTFLPNPEGKDTVNHKNGNKKDNRVENLEWATMKENNEHAIKTGLKDPKAQRNNWRSLPVAQYDRNMNFVARYKSTHEASRCTGIWQGNISQSARCGCKAGGYFWKYEN